MALRHRNPLRAEGTPLQPNRLLAAKLAAVALAPLLPFRPDAPLGWAALALAALLLLNFRPRTVCMALAAALPLAGGADLVPAACVAAAAALTPDRWQPELPPWLLWANALAHLAVILTTGFLPPVSRAMLAATFLFVRWPRSPLLVIYDGDCGFCERSKNFLAALDFENRFHFQPLQTGAGRAHGISDEAASARMHLVAGGEVSGGFRAVRRILLLNPVTHLAGALLVLTPLFPRAAAIAAAVFFFPLFEPAGEAVYGWVARHRHKLFPYPACKLDPPGRG